MSNSLMLRKRCPPSDVQKTALLDEIMYYDKRIEVERSKRRERFHFNDDYSSDSDNGIPMDNGPSVTQLKQQRSQLSTCLQATQELTGLQILQSEETFLVDDPIMQGEEPVNEAGVWHKMSAECRIDLVAFAISFYVHHPDRKFAPISYRGLKVELTKPAHEIELNNSLLANLTRPTDAIEVLSSYASAHRSRRHTLARLAEKYGDALHMETMTEGGYLLRCANILEISWTLQNKWSPIVPFHHRLKFDLEYMDETHLKIVKQCHRQLADPTVETDKRTFLLSKIISTCLEAYKITDESYESMESETEMTQKLQKRRTTFDHEPDVPAMETQKELMAPPKSLPKKIKPKGKENRVENRNSNAKPLKRSNGDDNSVHNTKTYKNDNKKAKSDNRVTMIDETDNVTNSKIDDISNVATKDSTSQRSSNTQKIDNVASIKNKPQIKDKNIANAKKKVTESTINNKVKKNNNNVTDTKNSVQNKANKLPENVATKVKSVTKAKNNVTGSTDANNKPGTKKNLVSKKNNDKRKSDNGKIVDNTKNNTVNTNKTVDKGGEINENVAIVKNTARKSVASVKNKAVLADRGDTKVNDTKNSKTDTNQKKNSNGNTKNNPKIVANPSKLPKMTLQIETIKQHNENGQQSRIPLKTQLKRKIVTDNVLSGNTAGLQDGGQNQNGGQSKQIFDRIKSKIPRLSPRLQKKPAQKM